MPPAAAFPAGSSDTNRFRPSLGSVLRLVTILTLEHSVQSTYLVSSWASGSKSRMTGQFDTEFSFQRSSLKSQKRPPRDCSGTVVPEGDPPRVGWGFNF